MEPNENKQLPKGKKETTTKKQPRERKYKPVPGETQEQTKARKEAERIKKRTELIKERTKTATTIKEDLKQTLILQYQENETYKNTRYTPERREAVFNAVIDEIEKGESVTNAMAKYRVYGRTFFEWIDNDINFFNRYARAHTKRADALFNRMIDVAINMPDVNRARLVNDTIKYVCARLSPEKYSEKQSINIIGNVNQNITTLSPEDRDEKIKQLYLKAQNYIDVTPE